MKHNLLKSVIISVILLMGVSNAWGADNNNINNITSVYIRGGMNGWANSNDWKLSQGNDANNWKGTFYLNTTQEFKMYINNKYYACDGKNFNSASTYQDYLYSDGGSNMKITRYSTNGADGYVKLDVELWGNYGNGSYNTSRLQIKQSLVTALSPSLSASSTSLIKSGKSTITASCSGGSGSYTYTYKVTCDGSDVTNSTLNANTGSSVTFTAPSSVTGKKTYTITVTAKDSHALLSGLATKTATKTITVEEAHDVTVSYKYGSTTIKDNTTTSNVKYATASSISAPTITGYKFSSWTLGTGINNKSANLTTNPISITTKSSGTYTLTANYTEDLTSTWHIVGKPTSIFHGAEEWAADNDNMLKKTTGASTASKGSLTIDVKTLPANNSSYQFKVLNTNGTKWYGWSNSENYWVNRTNNTTNVYRADNNNLYFIPDALGEYKFDVDWSSSNPSLKVTFPTAYTVTFGKGTGGSSVTAKYNSTSFNSGTKVQSGKTVTFTQTASAGYTFKEWNTKSDGTGTKLSTNATYTHTVAATNIVYAIYTPNKYTVRYNANGGTGSMADQAFIYGTSQNLTANAFTNIGYSFNGWNTKAAGTGTQYADQASVRNLTTTNNGTVNLYAQWKEITHTITIQSNDNSFGAVNKSSASVGQHTPISIIANPNIGYEFVNWTATDGITIANANYKNTTITATQEGTVTANFKKSKNTTVYLKPNAAWKQANARFAVYYWNNSQNSWVSMTTIDCNNEYYAAEIPSNCTGFQFVRMNGANNTNSDGNVWNRTSNFTVPKDSKTMLDMSKVYLKPNGNWKTAGARFAAYFYVNSDGSKYTWVDMTITNEDGVYYCQYPSDKNYDHVTFGRMNGSTTANNWDNENRWDQTNGMSLYSGENYFTIDEGQWGGNGNNNSGATGTWSYKFSEPTYDVTLNSSTFGDYGFTLNGQSFTSSASETKVYQVPIGATIQMFSNPYNNAYNGDIIMEKGGEKSEITNTDEQVTVNCDLTFDDNYKTTSAHVVYLAVPDNGGTWINSANQYNCLRALHNLLDINTDKDAGAVVTMTEVGNVKIEQTYHKYYRCKVPAGYNTIRFEKRANAGTWTNTDLATKKLFYEIPLNTVNSYRLSGQDGSLFVGSWEIAPGFEGDYRLLYIDNAPTNHPSNIVRLTDINETAIVSLHIYNKRENGFNGVNEAKVLLQRCTGYTEGIAQWEDIESHMVYGTSGATPAAAMLPGRKKNAELITSNGIEVINAVANDETRDYGSGVWNFTIQKTDGSATLLLDDEHLKPYEGNYYIRTSNAEGGWINYSIPANHMTFSSYAKKNSDFSHYFCKWVNISKDSPNVKFVVANDYGANISKELAGDDIIGTNTSDLPADANVRWQWNMVTNEVKRAYIDGATENNITVTKNTEDPVKLNDAGNWIYRRDLENIAPGDKITAITANYNEKSQTLLENTYQTDGMPMLTGEGTGYSVRVRYDFKINETKVYLIPTNTSTEATTNIDVLIERTNQGTAQQVSKAIKAADQENGYTVYAVMSFTQGHIEGSGTQSEKLYYWVSFPFDVRISDVFGFGEYGVHWIMEYYDGAERAKNGAWIDSPTYWRYITDTTSVDIPDNNKNLNCGILKANQGYVLALALNIANMGIFTNTNKVSLYFPSMSPITKQIDGDIIETTVTLDEYKCTIERDNRYIHDSNWHIIGVPSFSDKTQTLTQDDLLYFYTRDQQNDTYIATSATSAKDEEVEITFKSLHSYMVQYAGTINWATAWTLSQPQGLAAKRNADEEKTHSLRLELSQNGTYNDQTLVTLQEEGATEAFDMNLDLSKMMNAGNNIYTLAGEELIQVAGNALPIANTVIPVGVQIATAGEYTFAMPDGTDGIIVELIDYETNTRTNLLLSDYTTTLPQGICENRFALSVKPDKVATDVEHIGEGVKNNEAAKKYIIDGKLFLQKNGMLYDALGHIVR